MSEPVSVPHAAAPKATAAVVAMAAAAIEKRRRRVVVVFMVVPFWVWCSVVWWCHGGGLRLPRRTPGPARGYGRIARDKSVAEGRGGVSPWSGPVGEADAMYHGGGFARLQVMKVCGAGAQSAEETRMPQPPEVRAARRGGARPGTPPRGTPWSTATSLS